MTRPLGLRTDETIQSIASRSKGFLFLIILVAVLPAFLEGFDGSLFGFAAPFVVRNAHASPALLGVLATGYAAGMAIFSLVGGFLFDRFSVKYTILMSVAIFAVFTLVSGLSTSVAMLIIARLMVGVGIGMFQPAILAFLGDIYIESRSRSISAFGIVYGGGIFVAPYIIAPFLPHLQSPFVISAVLCVIALVAFYLVVPKTYKKIETHSIKTGVKGIFNRNVTILSFVILFYGITLFGYIGYASEYILKFLALHPGQAAPISSMYGLAGIICSFPVGMLADKIGRKHVLRLALLLVLVGGVGFFSVNRNVAGLCTFAFALGIGSSVPGLSAALGLDSVSEHLAGAVTGWLFFIFNIGSILGGLVFAAFLPLGFVHAGYITLGVSTLIALVVSLFTTTGIQIGSTPKSASIQNV